MANDERYHATITDFHRTGVFQRWNPPEKENSHKISDKIFFSDNDRIITLTANEKRIKIPWEFFVIANKAERKVLIVNKNKFEWTTIYPDWNYIQDNPITHQYGTIEGIDIDKNENFIFIIASQGTNKQLVILNRRTLELIDRIPNIQKILHVDNENHLNLVDTNWNLIEMISNFNQFAPWYVNTGQVIAENQQETVEVTDSSRKALGKALKWGISLDPNLDDSSINHQEDSNNDEALRRALRKTSISVAPSPEEESQWNEGNEGKEGKSKSTKKKPPKTPTLHQLFTQAKTFSEINKVYALAKQLNTHPQVKAVNGIIDPILQEISQKKEKIQLQEMFTSLKEIEKNLKNMSDFSDIITTKKRLEKIKKERSQILFNDQELDQLIKENLELVNQKISEYQKEHLGEVLNTIKKNANEIEKYMQNIDYILQITSIYNTDIWKDTKDMLKYLPEEEQMTIHKSLDEIVRKRQRALQTTINQEKKSELQQQETIIENIKININEIKTIIQNVNQEETLENIEKSDPLVTQTRKQISQLAPQKAQELENTLQQLFRERALSIKFSEQDDGKKVWALDQYGIPKSLYFVPEVHKKVTRDIYGLPLPNGNFQLQFRSSAGNIIEPDVNKKILGNYEFTYTFEERKKLKDAIRERNNNGTKQKYQELSKEYQKISPSERDTRTKKNEFSEMEKKYYVPRMLETMNKITGDGNLRDIHQRNRVPRMDSKTVITPSIQRRLASRGNTLNQQLTNRKGYMLIESEAWTGKNFKIDILWYLTNREVFDISCNEHTEKEDLLFSPEINEKGTFRTPSELIKGIQTPGAIILLDEANSLKPGVSKLLNPLLDHRRYINDPQQGKIKVHPSVLIVWAQNPREYIWTKPTPEEIVTRARIVKDDYMPAEEEAFQMSKYLNSTLANLTREEFQNYRNQYVIKEEKTNNKSIYRVFKDMKTVVDVAKKLREIALTTKRGKAEIGQELDRLFSPRESMQIIEDYNFTQDIKLSIKEIALPKIADYEQREYAEHIIDQITR